MFTNIRKQSSAFLCILTLLFTSLQGATMHAILVGDTNDYSQGTTMHKDINNMHAELTKAANMTGMKYEVILTYGSSTNRDNILNQIDQLKIEPDDVVVAYFSSHGYRTRAKTSPWPNIFFSNEYNGVELDLIIDMISQKGPRLLIAIADCCNNVIEGVNTQKTFEKRPVARALSTTEHIKLNYKNLFVKSAGVVIFTGSEPGDVSWGLIGRGGVLTLAFIHELKAAVNDNQPAEWEEMLSKLESRIAMINPSRGREKPQIPLYNVELTSGR